MTPAEWSHIILAALVLIGASVMLALGKVDSTVTISLYVLVITGSVGTQVSGNSVLKGLMAGLPLTAPAPILAAPVQTPASVMQVEAAG